MKNMMNNMMNNMKLSGISVVPVPTSSVVRRVTAELLGFLLLLIPSFLTSYLMDYMVEQHQEIPFIWIAVIVMVSILIHMFRFYFVQYRAQIYCNGLASEFSSIIGQKIASCNIPEYEAQSKSKIYNIMNSDISSIYTLANYLVAVPANIIKIILVLIVLFSAHYGLALTAVLLAPLYVLSSYTNKSKLAQLVQEERESADAWVQDMGVIINSKVSIDLNRAFPYLMSRFEEKKDAFYRIRNRQHFYLLITKELPALITTMAPLLILVIGGNLVVRGQLTIGTLMLSMQLISLVFEPLAEIAACHAEMMSQRPVFQRGKDFVALPDHEDAAESMEKNTSECAVGVKNEVSSNNIANVDDIENANNAAIYLKNATLLRPDDTPLFDIEKFNAQESGLILIKGENGCGKSSLFNLFAGVFADRLLKISEGGSYHIAHKYRSNLGYLFYPNFIFSGTVEENVVYGREISHHEYERIHTLLNLPPSDKQVIIKPENLSLGEKQKIYLARLLLGSYGFLLLDEPGSNLDDQTEANLIVELNERKKNSLLIVISHNNRYDSIADQIYQIRDRKIGGSCLDSKILTQYDEAGNRLTSCLRKYGDND